MGILWTIIIGFVAGFISRFFHPGNKYDPKGFISTTLLGIIGAFVGMTSWPRYSSSFIGAIIGAIIFLLVWGDYRTSKWTEAAAIAAKADEFEARIADAIRRFGTLKWRCPIALCFVGLLTLVLCSSFASRWDTNDDIAMSMVAGGYGIAAIPSSNLVLSNVIWGTLVRSMPAIMGVAGYSLASFAVLMLSGVVLLMGLLETGIGWIPSCIAIVLLLVDPLLFPQFTITAGFAAIASLTGFFIYLKRSNSWFLMLGVLLGFLAYVIRAEEFFLVMVVGLPLFLTKGVVKRKAIVALVIMGAGIAGAILINKAAYSSPEWRSFWELEPLRRGFTDFGVGETLKKNSEILAKFNMSKNDIDLLSNWFFVDPKISDPSILRELIISAEKDRLRNDMLWSGWKGVAALDRPDLLALVMASLGLTILSRRELPLILCWLLSLTAFFVIGATGRFGVDRVYIPVISCLVLATLLLHIPADPIRRKLAGAVLLIAALAQCTHTFSTSARLNRESVAIRESIKGFPTETVFIWGSDFPFEAVYPVFLKTPYPPFRFNVLAAFTWAPFSVAFDDSNAGRGFVNRFRSGDGVRIVADQGRIKLLSVYCAEHFQGRLNQIAIEKFERFTLHTIACW
jgi:uncharacterized membrane protein YeaQ/YmgE (transglycosylase-associated protein family)